MSQLILASSSLPRKSLLTRLAIPFEAVSPDVDEAILPNENPRDLVLRLAKKKAQAVATKYPDSLIIGADQVCVVGNKIFSKPSSLEDAEQQLKLMSGKEITFLIGLCLLNSKDDTDQTAVETIAVSFRELSTETIQNYLKKENVLNCAGSFKVEGLGIALVNKIIGDDYTALIGLPLIRLTAMLEKAGVLVFCPLL